jgi:hypothetical protein
MFGGGGGGGPGIKAFLPVGPPAFYPALAGGYGATLIFGFAPAAISGFSVGARTGFICCVIGTIGALTPYSPSGAASKHSSGNESSFCSNSDIRVSSLSSFSSTSCSFCSATLLKEFRNYDVLRMK